MNKTNLILPIILAAFIIASMRILGFWCGTYIENHKFFKKLLETLPGCIIVSLIAPFLLSQGILGLICLLVAFIIMYATRSFGLAMVAASTLLILGIIYL